MFLIRGVESTPRALIPGYFRARRHVSRVIPTHPTSPVSAAEHELPQGGKREVGVARYTTQEQSAPEEVMRAHHIMSAPVFSLWGDSTVEQATSAFAERRYRHIPIVDPQGSLIGLISDRDVLRFRAESLKRSGSEPLSKIMVTEVLVATPDTPIREIARTMFDERIGSLPIVDGDGGG